MDRYLQGRPNGDGRGVDRDTHGRDSQRHSRLGIAIDRHADYRQACQHLPSLGVRIEHAVRLALERIFDRRADIAHDHAVDFDFTL